MANPFVHLELTTPDVAKAKDFYGKMFNWTFEDNQMGPDMVYSIFKTRQRPRRRHLHHARSPHLLAPLRRRR